MLHGRDGPLVSPRARALLQELGLPPEVAREIDGLRPGRPHPRPRCRGLGGGGRASAPAELDGRADRATIPLRGRRGTIATRMVTSLQTARAADLGARARRQAARRAAHPPERGPDASPRIGVTAIVVKLVGRRAPRAPGAQRARHRDRDRAARGDQRRRRRRDRRRARRAGRRRRRPALDRARSTRASPSSRPVRATVRSTPDDLAGGTFTVSNGGIHPVDITTAILNPPQVRDPLDRPHPRPAGRRRRTARSRSGRRCRPASPSTTARSTAGRRPRSSPRSSRLVAALRRMLRVDDAAPRSLRETLLGLHRTMLTIRLFEQRVAREFRTGEIPGFVHMYIGEEAVAAGVCANLDDDDYVTSTHRGHGHCIAKGCELAADDGRDLRPRGRALQGARRLDAHRRLLARDARRERDRRRRHRARDRRRASRRSVRGERAGRGRVLRRRRREPGRAAREPQPRGDLEAAGALRLREQRLRRVDARRVRDERARRRDARAAAYGIPGVVADGADVRDVYAAARSAVERARAGEGPTLLEVKTLPLHGSLRGRPRPLPRRRATPRDPGARRARGAARASSSRRAPRPRPSSRPRRPSSRPRSTTAVEFARASPFPDPAERRALRLSRAGRAGGAR